MIRKLLLAAILALSVTPTLAQNTTCSNRPSGDSSNACANTRFVQDAISGGGGGTPGGTDGQIQYNNAGTFGGFTAGQDCTITPSTGAVNCTKLQNVPVTTTSASTNDILYYDGTGFIHTVLTSLINTVCTASPGICGQIFTTVNPIWYGAKCDGTTDDATAFQAAVTASTGLTISIPGGTCVIGTTISLPSNTKITAPGWNSIIKSTVTGGSPTFSTTNTSNVILSNFSILGTNTVVSWASASVGAYLITQNASCNLPTNIQFTHMNVSGFNASYWIELNSNSCTSLLSNFHFDDNTIITASANIPTSPTNGESNYGIIYYSGTSTNLRYSTFDRNNIDANSLCFGIMLFGQLQYVTVNDNNIQSPGQTTSSHCNNAGGTTINAYGIGIYDLNATSAQNFWSVSGNNISSPYASGIYSVGASNTASSSVNAIISNNIISNQTSTDNITLPRAGIALNSVSNIVVSGNALYDNFGGIDVGGVTSGIVHVIGNICTTGNGDANTHCTRITPANANPSGGLIAIKSNSYYVNSTGPAVILTNSSSSARFGSVDISGNALDSNSTILNAASQYVSGSTSAVLAIKGNTFNSLSSGTALSAVLTSGKIAFADNVFVVNGSAPTFSSIPSAGGVVPGSNLYISDAAPASSPCTGSSTGSVATSLNGAWKCF